MDLIEALKEKKEKIAVIGLGYVGLPLAIEFAKKYDVVGFDLNENKILEYKNAIDMTKEVGSEVLQSTMMKFTSDVEDIKDAKIYIIAVPTPITKDRKPDLSPVISASHIVGKALKKGDIVVYESTVYPGLTEEICLPILEKESGINCPADFKIGYSPERINPGDKVHTLSKVTKIVSGIDENALEILAAVYDEIIEAGVYKAGSIKIAEAAKVIENSQRDINIAFVNELAMIFEKMGIDTHAVLKAAGTKWNFLEFEPGLVGGHCIGVDPYYLTFKAEQLGYKPEVILAGRKINDSMGRYIADCINNELSKKGYKIENANIAICGLTFKENVPDIRNSKVIDIIFGLKEYGANVISADPIADPDEVEREYGIKLSSLDSLNDLDVLVLAVAHNEYKNINLREMRASFREHGPALLIDIKSIKDRGEAERLGYHYWNL